MVFSPNTISSLFLGKIPEKFTYLKIGLKRQNSKASKNWLFPTKSAGAN